MDEQTLKVISRIKQTADGQDFLKYLEQLSRKNYEEFKRASSDMNNICKGKALALDALISSFTSCDSMLKKLESSDHKQPEWI